LKNSTWKHRTWTVSKIIATLFIIFPWSVFRFGYYFKGYTEETFLFLRSVKSVTFYSFLTIDSHFRQMKIKTTERPLAWPINWPTADPLNDRPTDWLPYHLNDWSSDWPADWLNDRLTNELTDRETDRFAHRLPSRPPAFLSDLFIDCLINLLLPNLKAWLATRHSSTDQTHQTSKWLNVSVAVTKEYFLTSQTEWLSE
jgi:hypothetical protein